MATLRNSYNGDKHLILLPLVEGRSREGAAFSGDFLGLFLEKFLSATTGHAALRPQGLGAGRVEDFL